MNVLVWHVHGAYTTSLVHGAHTYLIPILPDRGEDGLGRAETYDWPENAVEVTPEQAAEADVVVEDISSYPSLMTPNDHAAVATVQRLADSSAPAGTVSFGTEAGIYAKAGIPTVVCGPGDIGRAHKANEWIGLDELAQAGRMMERLAAQLKRPAKEWITG